MIVVHTNIAQRVKIEDHHEDVMIKALKMDIAIPMVIGSMVSGWPLLCASVRRIDSNLSAITIAVPFEDGQKRFIHVRPKCFPWPGEQAQKVEGSVWFQHGMMELRFTAGLVVSLIVYLVADPAGSQRVGKPIWVSAMQAQDGALSTWMHLGHQGDPSDLQTILYSMPFLNVLWMPDELPRVLLCPPLFPGPSTGDVLFAISKDGSGFVIGYAGNGEWLSDVLQISREFQKLARSQHEPRWKFPFLRS